MDCDIRFPRESVGGSYEVFSFVAVHMEWTKMTNDGYILVVSLNSKAYKTKKEATEAAKRITSRKTKLRGIVTTPRKLSRGWVFTIRTFFHANTKAQAMTASRNAKKNVPGATTKIQAVKT